MTLEAAAAAGALTVAIVNDLASPLARCAAYVLDQHAGPERSVAATKSCITSMVAAARLIALWREDAGLLAALERLPERLEAAAALDWSAGLAVLAPAASLYVVGRGLGLGIAAESALKLKETSALHAEAVSAAELRHGPRAVLEPGFPVLLYALEDSASADAAALAESLVAAGQSCLIASAERPAAVFACRCRRRCTRCSIRSSRSRPSIRSLRRSPKPAAATRTGPRACRRSPRPFERARAALRYFAIWNSRVRV